MGRQYQLHLMDAVCDRHLLNPDVVTRDERKHELCLRHHWRSHNFGLVRPSFMHRVTPCLSISLITQHMVYSWVRFHYY